MIKKVNRKFYLEVDMNYFEANKKALNLKEI